MLLKDAYEPYTLSSHKYPDAFITQKFPFPSKAKPTGLVNIPEIPETEEVGPATPALEKLSIS
jgi:hypothetical protein